MTPINPVRTASFTTETSCFRWCPVGEEPYFARRVFEIPAAAGQANVAFAFHYSSPGNRWW